MADRYLSNDISPKENTAMKTGGRQNSLVVALLGAAAIFAALPAPAQQINGKSGFSFAVYGDSRSMMYLPYKKSEEAQARELMVDMFELALPAKVAPEVVAKDVKLI